MPTLLFVYWEYQGSDFDADMAHVVADPRTQSWWKLCGLCQVPLTTRQAGEHWAFMPQAFHVD